MARSVDGQRPSKSAEACSFGPDALETIDQAFADAWQDIEADYDTAESRSDARYKLAKLIFIGARTIRPLPAAQALKEAALRNMRGF